MKSFVRVTITQDKIVKEYFKCDKAGKVSIYNGTITLSNHLKINPTQYQKVLS